MKRFTALVVDDSVVNLVLAAGLLQQLGGVIHTADSGAKAIEMAYQTDFDIIFLDHLMPVMDGVETARLLRTLSSDVPIVALTGSIGENIREFFLSNGFDDFVAKPMVPDELRAVLSRHLSSNASVTLDPTSADAAPSDAPSEALRTALDGIAGLDVAAAVEVCDGSWTLYLDVARTFADTIPAKVDRMLGLLGCGDYKEVQIEFHALRAALSNVGVYSLAKMSDRLEKGCNDSPPDFVTRNGERFLSAVSELAKQLDAALVE